tara:strand:- start:6 stop:533 length:528 start_codon:yes stop_codon:yes gene_type:complete
MEISNNIIDSLQKVEINKSNEKNKERDCIELKNLEYKNVLMYGNNLKPKDDSSNVTMIENFLEKESQMNKLDLWTKLDKTDKIIKLKAYTKILVKNYNLNDDEEKKLNTYLIYCLERKHISKIKDINYNKSTGIIESIPNLLFNEETRSFYMKKGDKHGNTLKSLAPKKNKTQKF